jgi:hypothetical protein
MDKTSNAGTRGPAFAQAISTSFGPASAKAAEKILFFFAAFAFDRGSRSA